MVGLSIAELDELPIGSQVISAEDDGDEIFVFTKLADDRWTFCCEEDAQPTAEFVGFYGPVKVRGEVRNA